MRCKIRKYSQKLPPFRLLPPIYKISIKFLFPSCLFDIKFSTFRHKLPQTQLRPQPNRLAKHQNCPAKRTVKYLLWQFGYTKNQIHFESESMLCHILKDISNKQDSSSSLDLQTIFDKYKLGRANSSAPFRLFETNYTLSAESESDSHYDRKTRGPYRKYTFDQKMQAVERIIAGEDVKIISKEFGIPRRNLLRWKKNGCERKEGGGRPTDNQMEQVIYDKIKNRELTDEKQIRKLAVQMSKTSSFKASKGWFVKFCHRFNLHFRQQQDQMEKQNISMVLQL